MRTANRVSKPFIEGANLFLTQEARLRLEEKGVILYKDASANKGGVTSSSLEVLASLVMTDKEWDELMCVKDGAESDFRLQYIKEILEAIRENARLEFEIIWQENARLGLPRAILTDLISEKINEIKDSIRESDLFKDRALLKKVIEAGVQNLCWIWWESTACWPNCRRIISGPFSLHAWQAAMSISMV
jgi:glutamate dehydrogenase